MFKQEIRFLFTKIYLIAKYIDCNLKNNIYLLIYFMDVLDTIENSQFSENISTEFCASERLLTSYCLASSLPRFY